MAEENFLVIRMSSLGDIIHTLPAVAALRDSFPEARIDWLCEKKWASLLEGNAELTSVIPVEKRSFQSLQSTFSRLRAKGYSAAIDFQGLYKSAILGLLSGAPKRIGFARAYAREAGASVMYNCAVIPQGRHIVERGMSLAERAGARRGAIRFTIPVNPEAEEWAAGQLEANNLGEFFVLCPGAGWKSKCWPPERYGELHRRLRELYGWRGVISYGPGEEGLVHPTCLAAGDSQPLPLAMNLLELMAVLRRAKFVVAADTGPLHLAAALGRPVVGLYGATDPARNGPYGESGVVCNVQFSENAFPRGDHPRGDEWSPAMISITVEQVLEAVQRRMGLG